MSLSNRVLVSQEMENFSGTCKEEEQLDLPPGFRFHPTDEELISHYLHKKVIDTNFSARAIGEVDLNKSEPWDLPCKFAKFKKFSSFLFFVFPCVSLFLFVRKIFDKNLLGFFV
jgi:hypothetical protein